MSTEKPRILIADDEGHIRTLIKAVIKMLGFDVVAEASNGQEAVERFKECKPDMTLLDINMPLKTGLDALQEIMAIAPDTCVIMLTSLSDRTSIEQCVNLGASNYIRKDTPIPEMKEMLTDTWKSHLVK